ncbi:hypothetical protein Ciccas_011604 [Cichlidogyrus casuarinus]|uniref:Uncharacterized protein n=1 Tax=Cichlidogyrus casuarinus TaxID=1844966 RepID=A0ABD2PQS3_9PLAT
MSTEFEDDEFLVLHPSANVLEELTSLLTFYKSQKTTLEIIFKKYGYTVFEDSNFSKIIDAADGAMLKTTASKLVSDAEIADLEEGALAKIGLLSTRVLELTRDNEELKKKEAQLEETLRRQDGEITNLRKEIDQLRSDISDERSKLEAKHGEILELTKEKHRQESENTSLVNELNAKLSLLESKPTGLFHVLLTLRNSFDALSSACARG